MSIEEPGPVATHDEGDYRAIEAAVMETDRGRWFLSEYARRNRASDTSSILDALSKLEQIAEPIEHASGAGNERGARRLLASARSVPWQGAASLDRPAHTRPQRAAEASIAAARRTAEKIREVAYELREAGLAEMYAEALDLYCRDLSSAMDLQEDATNRLVELAAMLETIEAELGAGQDDMPEPASEAPEASAPAVETDARRTETEAAAIDNPSSVESAPPTQPASIDSDDGSPDRKPTSSAPTLTFVNPG